MVVAAPAKWKKDGHVPERRSAAMGVRFHLEQLACNQGGTRVYPGKMMLRMIRMVRMLDRQLISAVMLMSS